MYLFKWLIKLINFLIIAAVLLAGAAASLFWLPTGRTVIKPALNYVNENYLQPLKVDIKEIDGTLYQGYSLKDLKIFSGDELYVSLDYAALSPDWEALLSDKPLMKLVKLFELGGLSADANNLLNIANYFTSSEDDGQESSLNPADILAPININVNRVNINNIIAVINEADKLDFSLNNLSLNESGDIALKSNLILNNKNILPVDLDAEINFADLEILKSKIKIGQGVGAVKGGLKDLRVDLTAFKLDDFMPLAKIFIKDEESLNASGRIDGRIFLKNLDEDLSANGVISLQQAKITREKLSVPLSVRVPFDWSNDILKFKDLNLKTKAAELKLDAELNENNIKAQGSAKNISLREIGGIAAPELSLKGEGGSLDFDILLKGITQGFDLNKIFAKLDANLPELAALNKNLAKNFNLKLNLKPNTKPEINCAGEIFGGKLSASGEVYQDKNNNIKPELLINLANLDLAALAAAFPELNNFRPSGKLNLNTRVHSDLNIDGNLNSAKLAAKISGSNYALNNLKAEFNYDVNNNKALLKNFKANFNQALINAAGLADIKNNNLDFKLAARNFNPGTLAQLKNQVKGLFNIDAVIKGSFNNPAANIKINAKNVAVDNDIKLGALDLALNYFNNTLNIAQSQVRMPGGALNFKGNINLNNLANPRLNFDLSSGQSGINLAQVSQNLKLAQPVTGNIKGAASVTGNLKNLGAKIILNANNIKTQGVNIPYAVVEAGGNAGQIKVNKLEAKINEAKITGRGGIKINNKNLLASALNIILSVNGLEVRPLLTRLMGSSPLGGILYGDLAFTGTAKDPTLSVKVKSPLTVNQTLIDLMSLKLNSPGKDKYKLNAEAKVADFKLDLNGLLTKHNDVYLFDVKSQPIDINKLLAAKVPSLKGMVSGNAFIKLNGSSKLNFPVNILASVPSLKIMDGKINIKNIAVPIKFMLDANKIAVKNARAELASGGVITSNIDVDLNKSIWTGNASVNKLDFGKLAAPFLKEYLKEGELVGLVDASAVMKGNLGVFALTTASGKFKTSPGYFHKMKILERITPAKKISFDNIRGTFAWDGSDLFLNPGTQATAPNDEPLYRYFAVNGSCGLSGKNLRLLCDGRFDLKILDRILGAMKGVFQYMTGALTSGLNGASFLKDSAGRMLGIKKRDYQNVTFTLAKSWSELQLLDLKITKPIQDFLPLDKLNSLNEETQQKSGKQFKLNLKIPVGQGNLNPEDDTTKDQLKEQLLDNLFNF